MSLAQDYEINRQLKAEAKAKREALMIRAARQGLNGSQIAKRVGCSVSHAQRVVARFRSSVTPDLSLDLDHLKAARLIEARQRAAESEV